MIGCISSGFENEYDFKIFLENPEIVNLEKQTLEGTVIDLSKPEKQNPLQMSVNDGKTAKTTFRKYQKIYLNDIVIEGIEIDKCQIFISKNYYAKLKDNGSIGGRYGLHKIDIIEETLAEEGGIFYEEFGNDLKYLKRQNRN